MEDDIRLKIITSVKIQAIVNGKKTTRRRFNNIGVYFPPQLRKIFLSYCNDVKAEIIAERRTPEEWVDLIERHTFSNDLRGWAASIIWFKYGGNDDTVLYKLSKSFDHRKCTAKLSKVMAILDSMGCPRFVCDPAAIRERKRTYTFTKYMRDHKQVTLEGT